MTTLTELGPAGIARAGSFVEDAILAMRRFLRGFEFMFGMAALFAWTLIDAGALAGWPLGAFARALFGAFLLMLPRSRVVRWDSTRCGVGLLPPAKTANRRPTDTGFGTSLMEI
jgi:hypothetical protein